MKTYRFEKELKRNTWIPALFYRDYIYKYRWILFDEGTCTDTIKFKRNGTVDVTENGVCRQYDFQHPWFNEFCLSSESERLKFRIVYMDAHLLVFRMVDKGEYLILVAPEDLAKLNLVTLEAIESYIYSAHPKEKKQSISVIPADVVSDEATEEESDEDYSEFGDFTKEEIIYDYLQRQEEEQAEEDYYLEQMKKDD